MVEGTIDDRPFRCVFRNVDTGLDDDIPPTACTILRALWLKGDGGYLLVVEYREAG